MIVKINSLCVSMTSVLYFIQVGKISRQGMGCQCRRIIPNWFCFSFLYWRMRLSILSNFLHLKLPKMIRCLLILSKLHFLSMNFRITKAIHSVLQYVLSNQHVLSIFYILYFPHNSQVRHQICKYEMTMLSLTNRCLIKINTVSKQH